MNNIGLQVCISSNPCPVPQPQCRWIIKLNRSHRTVKIMITTIGIILLIVALFVLIVNDEEGKIIEIYFILGITITLLGLVIGFFPIAKGNYSHGERIGIVSKVSNKGLFCKTNEGYILLGTTDSIGVVEKWEFTIKSDEVLKKINEKNGQKVTLIYQQYIYSTPCWGSSSYEIIDVK